MTFPIWWNGEILFRFGKPAMSLECCCVTCNYEIYAMNWEVNSTNTEPPSPSFPLSIADPGGVVSDAKLLFAAASWGSSPCVNGGNGRLHAIYISCVGWGGMGSAQDEIQGVLTSLNPAIGPVGFGGTDGFAYPNPTETEIYNTVDLDPTCQDDPLVNGGITIHYEWTPADLEVMGCCD